MSKEIDLIEAFKKFYPGIVNYLIRMIGPTEAEDLAQEVFEKAGRGLEGFKRESKLSTWLYRIARNTALDRLRSSSFKRLSGPSALEDGREARDMDVWSGQTKIDIDQEVMRKQMNECVREYIDNLPSDQRTVIVLSELEGFRDQEIADILQVSLEAVKIRLHRARVSLRKQLDKGCAFYRTEQNALACDRKLISIASGKSG